MNINKEIDIIELDITELDIIEVSDGLFVVVKK
jgi:hypothetical protein